jgi:hypothetical protein
MEGLRSSLQTGANMTEAANQRPYDEGLIITPSEVKKTYLFGVDLSDDDGNEMPDEMFKFYIRSAQDWLEKELGGVLLCEKEITERRDYYRADYQAFASIKLMRHPVQSVESIGFQFPLSSNVTNFDPSWYRIEAANGLVNLVPTQGTFSTILLSQGGNFLPLFYNGLDYVPHLWVIKYKAGFKKGQVPPMLRDIIGMKAAIGALNIAGDLIAGAGIASKSISLDGLSQSIGTTSSATNAGYGARIIQYSKQIDSMLEGLRERYQGISMVVS